MKLKIYENTQQKGRGNQFFDEDFRLLIAGPSGCGKTNTLLTILCMPLAFFDQLFIFTNTPQQDKIAFLQQKMDKISKKVGYNVLKVLPPTEIGMDYPPDSKKIIVFDDLLHEPKKVQEKITEHFTVGRHKNISPIILTQSFFSTPNAIRQNCTHMILYPPATTNHINLIARETMVDPSMFASFKPLEFLFVNRNKKQVAKNFDEVIS